MNVEEIKQAMVDLYDFCCYRVRCIKCPFGVPESNSNGLYTCRLGGTPDEWCIDEWRDDE